MDELLTTNSTVSTNTSVGADSDKNVFVDQPVTQNSGFKEVGAAASRIIAQKALSYDTLSMNLTSSLQNDSPDGGMAKITQTVKTFITRLISNSQGGDVVDVAALSSQTASFPVLQRFIGKVNDALVFNNQRPVSNINEWSPELDQAISTLKSIYITSGNYNVPTGGDVDYELLDNINTDIVALNDSMPKVSLASRAKDMVNVGINYTGPLLDNVVFMLNRIGYFIPRTNVFGNFLSTVIRDFQACRNLKPTGIVDSETYASLSNESVLGNRGFMSSDVDIILRSGLKVADPRLVNKLPPSHLGFIEVAIKTMIAELNNTLNKGGVLYFLKPMFKPLFKAIAWSESRFNPTAVGDTDYRLGPSIGLWQIQKRFIDTWSQKYSLPAWKYDDPVIQGKYLACYLRELDGWWNKGIIISGDGYTSVSEGPARVLNQLGIFGKQATGAALVIGVWRTGTLIRGWNDPLQPREVVTRLASFSLLLG